MTERCRCCGQPLPKEDSDLMAALRTEWFLCASPEEAHRLTRLRQRAHAEITALRRQLRTENAVRGTSSQCAKCESLDRCRDKNWCFAENRLYDRTVEPAPSAKAPPTRLTRWWYEFCRLAEKTYP